MKVKVKLLLRLQSTECADFDRKCTKKRLEAELRPDPLGSLRAPLAPSARPLAVEKGGRRGRRHQRNGVVSGGETGKEEMGRKGREERAERRGNGRTSI